MLWFLYNPTIFTLRCL